MYQKIMYQKMILLMDIDMGLDIDMGDPDAMIF